MPLLFWQRVEQLLPAYIRASMQAGIEIGFENGISYFGTNQKGAAEMLMEEQVHPEQLIDRVTTQRLHHCRT
jgi:pyrroline-5-carboxylate reductase